MVTVLTTFAHPNLGSVRGTVIDGVPMISCQEVSQLLGCADIGETEKALRNHYQTKEVFVPTYVLDHGVAVTEKMLFIDQEAVSCLIRYTANRTWQMYTVWFQDFVFPCLRKMWDTRRDPAYAAPFYWTCHDPKPETVRDPEIEALFDLME